MKSVCVFCGSAPGCREEYAQAAKRLGFILAENNLNLVYGGGNIGLMGVVADAVLERKGSVTGVITQKLKSIELAHAGAQEMIEVQGMDERKKIMTERSDAFLVLPGGFGTLDELFDVLSLNQLGIIEKPVGLLNTCGFYDSLLTHLDQCVARGFLREQHRKSLLVEEDPETLVKKIMAARPGGLGAWLEEFRK